MPIAVGDAAQALRWAQEEQREGTIEGFSLNPISLEDTYIRLVGSGAHGQGADDAALVPQLRPVAEVEPVAPVHRHPRVRRRSKLITAVIVIGFSLIIPDIDPWSASYLTTGAMTISLITVGMVVVPQVVAQRKEQGLLDYQRSMPVPRLAMLAADVIVWIAVVLPGLAGVLGVASLRFDLAFGISPMVVPAIVLVSAGSAAIGCGIAYAVKPVLVGVITNVITNLVMIIALMFAPVNHPAERLPDWAVAAPARLPLPYMAQAIRETVDVPLGGVPLPPFLVLAVWSVIGLTIPSRVMTRRV